MTCRARTAAWTRSRGRSLLTAGALNGLLAAAVTMRNPQRSATATRDGARALRAAVTALEEAAADVRRHEVTAQLLDLTD